MNRIKDYAGFAIWFAGLGYIVLWPLTSPEFGGKPFGASIFCRDGSPSALDLLCNSAHPLQLPPGLHAMGILSAIVVMVRLLSLRHQALAPLQPPPANPYWRREYRSRQRRRSGENRRARSARSSRARNSACAACRADRARAIWHNPG